MTCGLLVTRQINTVSPGVRGGGLIQETQVQVKAFPKKKKKRKKKKNELDQIHFVLDHCT